MNVLPEYIGSLSISKTKNNLNTLSNI